jgi:hypothetical protein
VNINAALGEKDKAFDWLGKTYEQRSWFLTYIKVEPTFDPLRSDPRFQYMLRRMNLEPYRHDRPNISHYRILEKLGGGGMAGGLRCGRPQAAPPVVLK